ncbi:MAG: T9SS type A sorting domain-containing protein [Bacteroidetes bacterium]|nr:T9SS type A sorting domain-containing protein [Bacteroidota bacterium]
MKHISLFLCSFLCSFIGLAQTPVPMAFQPALTYVENFDSIGFWANNFASGYGSNRFASVPIGGTNAIPDPTKITTSSAAWATQSSGGLQRDSINGKMMMLVTGTTNNTSSVAFDFFMDFTGINAGTLSFNWATVFNGTSTSNRNGALKVYASINGTTFTELTGAAVSITNYISANGSIANLALPASFNNNPNARLRFYYFNATGGSSGSRPLISIDDLTITATGNPCATPTSSATGLTFSNLTPTSFQGNFTTASPAPDEYLIVMTDQGNLNDTPVNGVVYHVGDIIGTGTVIYRGNNPSFSATNLSPQTPYTFYIFSSNIYCNGIIRYKTQNPLVGMQMTPAGPPCVPPTTQPSNLIFGKPTTHTIPVSFTAGQGASEYLVIASKNSTLSNFPVNGTQYQVGNYLGNDTVVYRGAGTSFIAGNLSHSTNYHFFVFALNNYACSNGPVYLLTSPLIGQKSTTIFYNCQTPNGDASNLNFTTGSNFIHGFFNPYPSVVNGYLVVMSANNTLSAMPQNQSSYTIGNSLGGGTVVSTGANYSFSANNLMANTTYNFFVFGYNDDCIGGPIYRTITYLQGSTATTNNPAYHFYFGNLHAHSSYSDGNKDNATYTPTDDYSYAQNALCMDFLGISEHNHYSQAKNPGMLLPKYQLGLTEAANYTSTHSGFLALYGMEWGTISSGGGHVLVYGVDSLIGWEKLNGSPNYDIYVPKNDYLSDSGLFRKVLNASSNRAFATLAHPSFSDFGNLAYQSLNARADSALVGIAVESGPAFSTNTNYTDPASSMSYLPYYQAMLARGYRVAPLVDHDNHYTTFGTTAYSRTAVIAPSLSKNDFMIAMNQMRFYATEDCDTRAEILVYNRQMGTEITHSFAPALTIYAYDPTNPTGTPHITLMSGRPGSNTVATALTSISGRTLNFTDFSLPDSAIAYYYADITIAGKRTITAPVWYKRIDTGMILIDKIASISEKDNLIFKINNNPAFENVGVNMSLNQPTTVVLKLYNITGQILQSKTINAPSGKSETTLSLSGLPAGMYFIEASADGTRWIQKFIHQ